MKTTVDYITKLANIPSPTGYTSHIMNYVIAELESFGYAPVRTNKGGVMVTITGKNDSKHRVVTAHLDTLGAMVRAVKPDGRLKMDLIGGFVYNAIEGENCSVTFLKMARKSVVQSLCTKHLYTFIKMLVRLSATKLTWKFALMKK
ncbi:Glutamyl aminopeptidase [Streptococcus pasteurianus]|nr:Glutamyl aminopeptidase [Streptococcus pasteurianus]